jgi:hypothetical protein
MVIESLVTKTYFLTSEQSECSASLSIEAAKYVVKREIAWSITDTQRLTT